MRDHPIQGLMKTAMESIKEMVDVNTVVGESVSYPPILREVIER